MIVHLFVSWSSKASIRLKQSWCTIRAQEVQKLGHWEPWQASN